MCPWADFGFLSAPSGGLPVAHQSSLGICLSQAASSLGGKSWLSCLDVLPCFTTVVILYFGTYARCWPLDAVFLRVSGWQGVPGCFRLSCSGCGVSLLQWGYTCAYCAVRPAKFLRALLLARIAPCYIARLRVLNKDILSCTQIQSLPSFFSNYQVWFYPWTHPGGWNLSSPSPPKYPIA